MSEPLTGRQVIVLSYAHTCPAECPRCDIGKLASDLDAAEAENARLRTLLDAAVGERLEVEGRYDTAFAEELRLRDENARLRERAEFHRKEYRDVQIDNTALRERVKALESALQEAGELLKRGTVFPQAVIDSWKDEDQPCERKETT